MSARSSVAPGVGPRTAGRDWRSLGLVILVGVVASYYGTALFERLLPHRWLRRFQRLFGNPSGRLMSGLPGWALLETTGRRSGQARQVPIGGRLIGDSFWLVAVDPARAGYVRNIAVDPHVRVRVGGRWREGIARVVPDDNPRRRMFRLNPVNGLYIAIAGREHISIRVDLDAGTTAGAS